jgi:hypothetical protein
LAHPSGAAVQRKRKLAQNEAIPKDYLQHVPGKAPDTLPPYAEAEYEKNLGRGRDLMAKVREAAQRAGPQSPKAIAVEPFSLPSPEFWDITPPSPKDQTIRGFGIAITYKHRTLTADGHPVEFGSDVKRDATGGIELRARANYAPNATSWEGVKADDPRRADPFAKMKLNDVWAHQIAYFQTIEQTEGTKFPGAAKPGKDASLAKITRSRVENPSTLFTYWLTNNFGAGGIVADENDRLALLGSPNGWSILYLLIEHPEMLAGVAPDGRLIEVAVQEAEVTNMTQTVLRL